MNSRRRDFFLAFASGHALVMGFLVIAEASGQHSFDGAVAILSALFGAVFFASLLDAPHKLHLLGAITLSVVMAASVYVPEKMVELASRLNCKYGDAAACMWLVEHRDDATGAKFAAIGCSRGDGQSCASIHRKEAVILRCVK